MSNNSSKQNLEREIRTIEIEHVIGEQVFTQSLTIPQRRPFKNLYQFRLILLGTDPSVWRRVQVPENYTFYDLHVAIQNVMEWWDYHLHHFDIPIKKNRGSSVHIECPLWAPWDMEEDWLTTTEVPVKEYLKNPSDKALYRYDYGDGWEMDIIFEKALSKKKNKTYPVCIDGELAPPPEDCGGIPGYYRCIEAFEAADDLEKLPDSEEKEELVELLVWLCGWNPYLFHHKKVKFDSPRKLFKKALQ